MTLRANDLSLPRVATKARRVVPLPARGADRQDVRARRRGRRIEQAMASVAVAFDHPRTMTAVLEVSKSVRRSDAAAVFERHAFLCIRMADVARAKFLIFLMSVALIALGVAGHAGVDAFHLVAVVALGHLRARGHLRRVHMIFMREALEAGRRPAQTELFQVLPESYEARVLPGDREQSPLRVGLVTRYAQLAPADFARGRA